MIENILIVVQTKLGLTDTFIRAHIEKLNGNIHYLYGYNLYYKTADDVPLREIYKPEFSRYSKLEKLLPNHWYFKLQQKRNQNYTDKALIKRYITENKIDVVLAEYGTTGSFIAPVCAEMNIPLVVHFHGFDASRYKIIEQFREGYLFMFSYAATIIAVSHAMKQALIEMGCPQDKIVINTYGPHPDYLKVKPNYQSNTIIAVGRQTYKKAPYLTILAFQKVLETYPHLKLKMIGDGVLLEVSKNMVKALGLENKVFLLGGLERQEIIKHMQDSFLYVQHSLVAADGDSEGTPVGIIEAMAAGLPVVSTRHAGIPDVVIEGVTGLLVEENDVNGMVNAIIELATKREKAKKMGEMSNIRIEENFTLGKHIQNLNQLITTLTSINN